MMTSAILRNWRNFKLISHRIFLYPFNAVINHSEDGESILQDVDIYDLNSSIIDQDFFSDASKAFNLLADCASIYYSITEAERLRKVANYLEIVDTHVKFLS